MAGLNRRRWRRWLHSPRMAQSHSTGNTHTHFKSHLKLKSTPFTLFAFNPSFSSPQVRRPRAAERGPPGGQDGTLQPVRGDGHPQPAAGAPGPAAPRAGPLSAPPAAGEGAAKGEPHPQHSLVEKHCFWELTKIRHRQMS